jgi:hypothetical protein
MYKSVLLDKRPDETFPKNMDFFRIVQKPIPTELKGENLLLIKVNVN